MIRPLVPETPALQFPELVPGSAPLRSRNLRSATDRPPDRRRCPLPALATRRLRILHVVNFLGFAGTELAVLKLARSLDRTLFTSSIACCTAAEPDLRRQPDVPVFEYGRPRTGNDWRLFAWLWRLFRRERPDIVHTHAWGTLCEGFVAARLAGVPFVIHGEHGSLETRSRNIRVQRWVWQRAAQVLSVSSRTSDRMAREIGFPRGRIRTVLNGVDTERFRPGDCADARRALRLPHDRLIVGTAGRLHPVKDHDTLLSAAAILKSQGLTFDVVIAGDGPLKADLLNRTHDLGLDGVVHFLGTRADVERVLQALDIFVLSSASEGLPNTVLEAMATQLPVVATRVGGTEECVEHGATGLLVPPRDPGTLAASILTLAADPARRHAMAVEARRRAETRFSLDAMVREYEAVYRDVAGLNVTPFARAATRSRRGTR